MNLNLEVMGSEVDCIGVFDGHGPNGENVSRYVAVRLCDLVNEVYCRDEDIGYDEAIESACFELDEQMRHEEDLMDDWGKVTGGSTCCAVFLKEGELYSCNVGDSRFIMSYSGKTHVITKDHKPSGTDERKRIREAGGFVSSDDRVDGILGVARSFGDYQVFVSYDCVFSRQKPEFHYLVQFKEDEELEPEDQRVSVEPDVRVITVDDNIDFLVIASDGLYDMMTNKEAIKFISELMDDDDTELPEICMRLIENCIVPIDPDTDMGSDNVTVMIAELK